MPRRPESRPRSFRSSRRAAPRSVSDDAPRRRAAARFVESVVSELDDPISPDFARSFVVNTSSENVAPDLADLLVEEILAVPARVWKQTFAGLLAYDDQTELPLIETPTLLVWGDADTLVSLAMQDQLASSIPDADVLVYPGVGHTPRWDDPVRFTNDLMMFTRGIRP